MPATAKTSTFRRFIDAVEPWYNWGAAGISSVRDETSGDGWFFELDWRGVHISIMVGRTPKATREAGYVG